MCILPRPNKANIMYDKNVMSSFSIVVLYFILPECSAIVRIAGTSPTATIGRNYTLTCDSILWGTGCSVSAYYIYHENILKSTNSTILFRPLKLPDVGLYICTITTGGFNFTSKPTFFPLFVQRKNN